MENNENDFKHLYWILACDEAVIDNEWKCEENGGGWPREYVEAAQEAVNSLLQTMGFSPSIKPLNEYIKKAKNLKGFKKFVLDVKKFKSSTPLSIPIKFLAVARAGSIYESVTETAVLKSENYAKNAALSAAYLIDCGKKEDKDKTWALRLIEYLGWREVGDLALAADAAVWILRQQQRDASLNSVKNFINLDLSRWPLVACPQERGYLAQIAYTKSNKKFNPVTYRELHYLTKTQEWDIGVKTRDLLQKDLNKLQCKLDPESTKGKMKEDVEVARECARKFVESRLSALFDIRSDPQKLVDKLVYRRKPPKATSRDHVRLSCMRHWNSYTPLAGTGACGRIGGGYFVMGPEGRGIIVDPGHGYLQAFFEDGLSLDQVAAVCATHDHTDHIGGLWELMEALSLHRLLWSDETPVRFFLPSCVRRNVDAIVQANKYFRGYLDKRDWLFETLDPASSSHFRFWAQNKVEYDVECFRAEHESHTGSSDPALGLRIAVHPISWRWEASIGFTGDGMLPVELQKWDPEDRQQEPPIGHAWDRLYDCAIVVAHIGTIEADIIEEMSRLTPTTFQRIALIGHRYTGARKRKSVMNEGHLGLLGVIRLLQWLSKVTLYNKKPTSNDSNRLVLISEFGAELAGCYAEVVQQLREKNNRWKKAIPVAADLGFIARIRKGKNDNLITEVCCSKCNWSRHRKGNGTTDKGWWHAPTKDLEQSVKWLSGRPVLTTECKRSTSRR